MTQTDLDVLFIDLPKTGPAQEPTGAVASGGARGFLESRRQTIMALTPFLALALFFTTGSCLWFLMVPVTGILLFGPGGKPVGTDKKSSRQWGRDDRGRGNDL